MPVRLNTLVGVSAEKLDEVGVFNSFIDMDSNFHVDPSLLNSLNIPEFENAREKFDDHFRKVMKLLKISQDKNDKFYAEAVKKLKFKEIPYISLGFSSEGNHGGGIGIHFARQLAETGKIIVDAGFEDPQIFELIGLFEEGIGSDRISDMTISIIYDNIVRYTERLTKELHIKSTRFKYSGEEIFLPKNEYNDGKPIMFLPRDLLRRIPIADSWHDISSVEGYNEELRERTNTIVGGSWKKYIKSRSKRSLKDELLSNKELLKHLLEVYEIKPRKPYDFKNDPFNEFKWIELANKAVEENAINLRKYNPVTPENILEVIKVICFQLKSLIEDNGWWEFLYDSDGTQRNERYVQKLLYGVADTYCRANNVDLSREPNAGSGPVDFKLSRGYDAKVNLEVKLSTNNNLLHGFEKQLPIYNKAEKSHHSVYLIIMTKNNRIKVNKVLTKARISRAAGLKTPSVIVIDGRKKLSASKRKS
ncbi:MAG: hypothetical protein ACRBG0_28185 [Lewinella sp.]|uniref:hypothetical protein n=1 Tax=Lewinella sp. TaxID=2004506 RepID=UPI003D6AC37F